MRKRKSLATEPAKVQPAKAAPTATEPVAKAIAQFPSKPHAEAFNIEQNFVAACLRDATRISDFSVEGFKKLRDDFVQKGSTTNDPIEQLMLEQILLLHHRLARVHALAGKANDVEALRILSAAAARLSGELRRMVLALRSYRSPVVTKAVTFVKMQAVAENQDVRFIDSQAGSSEEKIVIARTEVAGNNGKSEGFDNISDNPITRPSDRWAPERLEAAALD